MAVSQEFKNNWLECQEEYGKNIEAGDIPVLQFDDFDEAVSLPGVKFTAPFKGDGTDQYDSYCQLPLKTIKSVLDNKVSEVEGRVQQLEGDVSTAVTDAQTATQNANNAAGSVQSAITGANQAKEAAAAAAINANGKATLAEQKATLANNAAENANGKATLAEQKATLANNSAENANGKATVAQQKADLADQKATLADQKATAANTAANAANTAAGRVETAINDAATATAGAEKVNAEVDGLTVKITNRNGQTRTVSVSWDIYETYPSVAAMNADAANIPKSHFVSIATDDPTSAENARLYQKRSDGTMKYLGDLDQASANAWADWLNNKKPAIEQATTDANNAATLANGKAALADEKATLADQKASAANTQANRAKGYNDHPWEIGGDGYIYVWDETTSAMVRTNKMIIDFSDLTEQQRQQMIQDFLNMLVFASDETCESIIDELT